MRALHDYIKRAVWCCDIETTGFLEDLKTQKNPKLHNFGAVNAESGKEVLFSRSKNNLNELQEWLEDKILVFHNGITYDGEALKFFGYDMSKTTIVDSLALSWYLYPKRAKGGHGLESWGEEFGVPKPPVYDWVNGDPLEYDRRVMQDARITVRLWRKERRDLESLYDSREGRNNIIEYLNFKMHLQRMQSHHKWMVDVPLCDSTLADVEVQKDAKTLELGAVMPDVPTYAKKKRPKEPFKRDGTLSVHGTRWKALCDEHGWDFDSLEEHKIQDGSVPANPNAPLQRKAWLFSMGWEPETFEFKKNDDGSTRKIPQVNLKGGKLCPSILRLKEEHPDAGIEHLEGLGILSHRKGLLSGFLKNINPDGSITAECAGFTNTLRLKHSNLVNLPSTRVLLGKEIRACLKAPKGYQNIGSDLSSLEDRCKHHFQWKYDKEFVKKQMSDDFDPHLEVCISAGLLTEAQVQAHKDGKEDWSHIRHIGKGGNYSCQYGAGIPNLVRSLKISEEVATKVHTGYWKMNKSIKQIASSTTVKSCLGVQWQYNPVSKIWYWLKANKDRFSTLCQGLGAYIFDMWCYEANKIVLERWGREMPMAAQFHDELVFIVKSNTLPIWHDVLKKAIGKVDEALKLNRDLDCDVQIGDNYSEIH